MVAMSMRIHCIQLLLATLLKSSKVNTKEIDLQYKWRKLIPKPYTQLPKIQLETFSSRILYLENQLAFQTTALHVLWSDPLVGIQHWFHAYIAKYIIQFTAMCTFILQLQFAVQNITKKYFQCQVYNTYSISFFFLLSVSVFSLITKRGIIHSARVRRRCGHSISVYDSLVNLLVCAHQLSTSCQKKFPSVVIVYFSQVYINLFWF